MARTIELLLLRNIENLGIVGDVVKVKPGYARNFLLPHNHAEFPTAEKIEALKEDRARAMAQLEALRKERESLLEKLADVEIALTRSCNDQGLLYGSISQRDIAEGLEAAGYPVEVRAVRLNQSIRRIGTYHVPIQFSRELKTEISIQILPDRELEQFMEKEEAAVEAEASESGESEATVGAAAEKSGVGDRKAQPERAARDKSERA
ncbi:MAG: 50S ribosomal protein L9 [Phycisphaerales bacterium]|nr:50S ribosomal protein L9 [Phycisphaerales bacterium]